MSDAKALITRLGLRPHPEGGHFIETFRSSSMVAAHGGMRSASTAILFLLDAGEVSRWHRVRSDEVWHWYDGGELELLACERFGAPFIRHRLGPAARGMTPQAVVKAGWWQAARPISSHVLVGCTVAPGFDFADFTLIDPRSPEAAWFRGQEAGRLVDG